MKWYDIINPGTTPHGACATGQTRHSRQSVLGGNLNSRLGLLNKAATLKKMEALRTHPHGAAGRQRGGVHSAIVVTLSKVFTLPKALIRVATSCFIRGTMRNEDLVAPEKYATLSHQGAATETTLLDQSNPGPRLCVLIVPLRTSADILGEGVSDRLNVGTIHTVGRGQ
jgi:hypothetical protein